MTTRRGFLASLPTTGAAFALGGALFEEASAQTAEAAAPLEGHFHPRGKAPSSHTIEAIRASADGLPFQDTRDLEEQARGLIARRSDPRIMADAGNVAFDMSDYDFLNTGEAFDSIHPSMTRIARLNNNFGLYEVIPGIYQVRGFDLSDMTFVRGKTGWIVFDPLTMTETARAAWDLLQEHVGEGLQLKAVIYSHTHGDHWGGVRGIVSEEDMREGRVEIIAPQDFMQFTMSENVFAGNAMNRRLFYQYGLLLPVSPHGFVTQGLGHRIPNGRTGLVAPTRFVSEPIEEFEVDGVRMIFQNTPNTEAPREMNTYLPDMKALWMAENVTATLHNIYTLRGAAVRDPLNWSKYINETLYLFGDEAEVMFASHHWPRWGNERVKEVLRDQRDLYANMNNQVLHFANQGVTINQIHNVYEMPASLQQKWHCRGYHGSPEHNARGVIQRYLGFWDCNPTTLIPKSPADSAPLYVEMMGGAGAILARAAELHEAGEYLLATEILDKLVLSDPANRDAKEALADAFEQLGYQQENPGLRNSFLAAAYELRDGIPQGEAASSASPDVIRAMSTELFLNFLAIRMDGRRAEGMALKMNLSTPDNGEQFVVELSNATLTTIAGYQVEDADLSLTLNRADLELVMAGQAAFEDLLADGRAVAEGDVGVLVQLAGLMVDFDPRFPIMPGTGPEVEIPGTEPFKGAIGAVIPE
ncbi:alkyl/aryl-sulfatase [Pseudoruegeria sp. SHC-113]|uniref:alkyl/aryl-sulfatase n=1 Tax=Pseudoruegeria sp. SHC-113 TaxID=2855439 RepID=UPI0021BA77B2|nr:alkyl sulfatase dimerization domain-containing protein [Pseudoruegeria sp. SHC-113]MCT8162124.1 MBL fold metallo-hydrolase [Pseudoruegeria sp. SHC-113]